MLIDIRRFAAVAVAFSAITLGLSAHGKPLDPISAEETFMRMAELAHSPWNGVFTEGDKSGWDSCEKLDVTIEVEDPNSAEKWNLVVSEARPRVKGSKLTPAMMIVPTMERSAVVEPKIQNKLCSAGIGSVIVDAVDRIIPEVMPAWGIEDIRSRKAVLGLRTVLDYLERNPRFDPKRLGMIGLSLGGVMTSLVAGLEPDRLKAVVIVVGAGNFPYVLANSDNKWATEFRSRRMQHLGISSRDEYEDLLRQYMRYDPLHFAPFVKRERVMMVTAASDTKVPTVSQFELYKALGEPKQDAYSGGHVEAILSMTYLYFGTVVNFLKDVFEMRLTPLPLYLAQAPRDARPSLLIPDLPFEVAVQLHPALKGAHDESHFGRESLAH